MASKGGVKHTAGPSKAEAGTKEIRGRVRRATFADLEAVVDINDNVYDGIDYLESLYFTFLHSKEFAVYVYEADDGKLISLNMMRFHPEAEDLATIMAIRVRSSAVGQGFGRPEANPIMHQIRKDYPKLTRYIIQTLLKPNIQAKLDKSGIGKLLYHWNIMTYMLPDRQQLTRFARLNCYKDTNPRPTNVSYAQGSDWLTRSDQLIKFLSQFADEYVVAGAKWTPVKLNDYDLRLLFANSNIFMSFGEGSPGHRSGVVEQVDNFRLDQDREVAGFSCSGTFGCKHGLNIGVHYYGNSENDLMSHIYSHLRHYLDVVTNDVRLALTLHFPQTIDRRSVQGRLREGLGDSLNFGYYLNVTQAVQYVSAFDAPLSKL